MAKRFTDTEKWKDDWFLNLTNDQKIIWFWLLDNCNHGGLCKRSIRLLNIMTSTNFTEEQILSFFEGRLFIHNDYWFIPKFLIFQYGNNFNTSKQPSVKSAIKDLQSVGILKKVDSSKTQFSIGYGLPLITLTEPFPNSSQTIIDTDTDIDTATNTATNTLTNSVGLLYDEKHKDFDRLVLMFPQGKRDYDPHSLTIWENLPQRDKDLCLQLTPHYVEHHIKTGKDKFIKNIKKFLEEGFHKQLNEFQTRYLGKHVLIKQSESKKESDTEKKERLRQELWGDSRPKI